MPVLPALYSAVPTVAVDGTDSALLERSLSSLLVEESTDGLFTCAATFQNSGEATGGVGFPLFDAEVLDFGSELTISSGGGDRSGVLFSGRVTALNPSFPQHRTPELTVLADDRLQDLRMTRRTRVFEDMTDADIISTVAREQGLTADVSGDGPTHQVVAQVDQSDLSFLRDRARRMGAEIWVDGKTIGVADRPDRIQEPIPCSYRQNLRDVQLSADLTGQRTSMAVSGWDPSTKQAIDVQADQSAVGSERSGRGSAGFELVEQVFGERPERIVHGLPLATDDAQQLADSAFRRSARSFVSGEIIIEGDARVRVGSLVELVGIGTAFSGRYYVAEVKHLFDLDEGFRTLASLERMELSQ